jgi:hypothetical protein
MRKAERPETNRVGGIARFRGRWDEQKRQDRGTLRNSWGVGGHINLEGSAVCFSSLIFTPADPEFMQSIENGVRELVGVLIDEIDCITYSSCEGHAPADSSPMRLRHVGILPRDSEQYVQLAGLLQTAAEGAHAKCASGTVRIAINRTVINTDGPDVPGIDVFFTDATGDWSFYSKDVGPVYRELIGQLNDLAPAFRLLCGQM